MLTVNSIHVTGMIKGQIKPTASEYVNVIYTQYIFDDNFCLYHKNGKPSTEQANIDDYAALKAYDLEGNLKAIYNNKTYASDADFIEYLESQIDPYTDYIEDGRQMRQAEARNADIKIQINDFKNLFSEHSKSYVFE